jgi:hypothetical protein
VNAVHVYGSQNLNEFFLKNFFCHDFFRKLGLEINFSGKLFWLYSQIIQVENFSQNLRQTILRTFVRTYLRKFFEYALTAGIHKKLQLLVWYCAVKGDIIVLNAPLS